MVANEVTWQNDSTRRHTRTTPHSTHARARAETHACVRVCAHARACAGAHARARAPERSHCVLYTVVYKICGDGTRRCVRACVCVRGCARSTHARDARAAGSVVQHAAAQAVEAFLSPRAPARRARRRATHARGAGHARERGLVRDAQRAACVRVRMCVR